MKAGGAGTGHGRWSQQGNSSPCFQWKALICPGRLGESPPGVRLKPGGNAYRNREFLSVRNFFIFPNLKLIQLMTFFIQKKPALDPMMLMFPPTPDIPRLLAPLKVVLKLEISSVLVVEAPNRLGWVS